MADQFGQQPTVVLSDESQRTAGKDALSMNIDAGSAVAEAVRTTLGPRGMDKMLVSDAGDVVVTNDGVTVLEEMDVDHPAAEMIVDVAETQEAEVGDGTTTAVVLAGALLEEAEDLVDDGIHPSTIVAGYREAGAAIDDLLAASTTEVSPDDTEVLEGIASTAMTGKGAESAVEEIAPLIVEAVRRTVVDGEPDVDAVKIQRFPGDTIADTRLVEGMMVDRKPDHPNMSGDLDDADILVYDGDLEVTESAVDTEITVSDAAELDAFVEQERAELENLADGIVEAGVDALFASGGIDDAVQGRFAEADVLSVANVRDPDVDKLTKTTGAARVSELADLSVEDLGHAGSIRHELIRNKYGPKSAKPEKSLVISEVADARAVTLVLRGGTEHVVEELKRAVEDALRVVAATVSDGRIVPGGGAVEVEVAQGLRERADAVAGREQLAVEAVADALETVPRTLAENGGLDPIDALVTLRAAHEDGDVNAGFDAHSGEVVDMHEAGVVEPRSVKSQALGAGVDAVTSVLRIDDVISAGELKTEDDDDEHDTGMNPYA